MPHEFRTEGALADEHVEDLLDDLELRSRADVDAAREMSAVHRQVAVEIRPGNASERGRRVDAGEAFELRAGGASCLAAVPVAVGDVFHLTFDRARFDVEPQLAVCDRCTMLGEGSFEVRFRFVHEVRLPTES